MIGGAAMFASLPKPPSVTAGRTGAPPFLVLMLLMQLVHGDVDLDGDHLVKKLLMLMLSTASSFMEMLIWMGPPGEKAVDVDVVHSPTLLQLCF